MLDLGFCKTSQNLSSFKQLLYLLFHRWGPKGNVQKPARTRQNYALFFFEVLPLAPL
jgi:hypothetical protein